MYKRGNSFYKYFEDTKTEILDMYIIYFLNMHKYTDSVLSRYLKRKILKILKILQKKLNGLFKIICHHRV